jgi:pyrimidine deaminase RibD-like protein
MIPFDRQFMEITIDAARSSKGNIHDPRVGAVAVLNGQEIDRGYRGEFEPGQHAEFVLLGKHLENAALAGATVYTTLEPCTERNPPKIGCVDRLIQRRVSRVVIGMLDPNPLVRGNGWMKLRKAGIRVAVIEEDDLVKQLEELNRDIIQAIEKNTVHSAAEEILSLATRSGTPCQKYAAASALKDCLDSMRRIRGGEIRIPGREAGYFRRFLERLNDTQRPECVKAFIRLAAFDPKELIDKSWFDAFYNELYKAARDNKLVIEYIF